MLGKLLEELTLQYSFEQIVDVSALSVLQDIETVPLRITKKRSLEEGCC